jgi:biotin carboxyl carrier protein
VILDAAVDGQAHRVEVTGGKGRYTVAIDGRPLEVDWREAGGPFVSLLVGGRSHHVALETRPGGYRVLVESHDFAVEVLETTRDAAFAHRGPAGRARLVAPMPGRIVRVLAEPGQEVEAGQGLVVMEAMKMENELRAPRAGRVAEVHVSERQTVETGSLLVVVE